MNRIKQFRKAQKMTQQALAGASGISRSHLAEFETGAKDPAVRHLEQIAAALGVSPGDLIQPDDTIATTMAELASIVARADPAGQAHILAAARLVDRAAPSTPGQTPKGRTDGQD